jgi:hypothetical protein
MESPVLTPKQRAPRARKAVRARRNTGSETTCPKLVLVVSLVSLTTAVLYFGAAVANVLPHSPSSSVVVVTPAQLGANMPRIPVTQRDTCSLSSDSPVPAQGDPLTGLTPGDVTSTGAGQGHSTAPHPAQGGGQ